MSAPIKREDIRKGDRVRLSFEFTAESDYTQAADNSDDSYELIERPVVLPTIPDAYRAQNGSLWELRGETEDTVQHWRADGAFMLHSDARGFAPFTRLRPEAEVVVEVLSAVNAFEPIYKLAEQYGVTL